jgi:hypothetical protein
LTTTSQAHAALRARIDAANLSFNVLYQGERFTLPDEPTLFAYVELLVDPAQIVAYGAGRLSNVHRHTGRLLAYVFAPSGAGLAVATDAAELIAAQLRSFRDADVSCFGAAVRPGGDGADLTPPGMSSAVDGYYWALVEVDLFFDLIG